MKYYIKTYSGNIPFKTFYIKGEKQTLTIVKHNWGELHFLSSPNFSEHSYRSTECEEITDPQITNHLQSIYEYYTRINQIFQELKN